MLIAEDEGLVRGFVSEALETLGYKVLVASDGEEALHLAQDHGSIDLLLTDVMMPGLDSHKLVDRFREAHPDTPVVYMTGYNRDLVPPVPGSVWLWKPFTLKELTNGLEQALGRSAGSD